MSENRIDVLFEGSRKKGQRAFMPFLTAGDPDLRMTAEVARAISEISEGYGVPLLLEIGFPYSDPIADGPTIQASYTRALERGVRISKIFDTVHELRQQIETPLVAMVSYSLVFERGLKEFFRLAQEAGFDGAIIPDLPMEESEEVHAIAQERDCHIIQLIAPTTPEARALKIARSSSGFIYYISVTGITGERETLPDDLVARVDRLRQWTELPICIGFGIGKPEHVQLVGDIADGVIVGSAIVRRVAELQPGDSAAFKGVIDFIATLLEPLRCER